VRPPKGGWPFLLVLCESEETKGKKPRWVSVEKEEKRMSGVSPGIVQRGKKGKRGSSTGKERGRAREGEEMKEMKGRERNNFDFGVSQIFRD
jgi:hypothetical protein